MPTIFCLQNMNHKSAYYHELLFIDITKIFPSMSAENDIFFPMIAQHTNKKLEQFCSNVLLSLFNNFIQKCYQIVEMNPRANYEAK